MSAAAPEDAVTREHNCQTPGCPNDFEVITVRVSETQTPDFECLKCCMAKWVAVMQQVLGGQASAEHTAPASSGAAQQ
jgi:hypothetical protein